jgi:hypothetical protein
MPKVKRNSSICSYCTSLDMPIWTISVCRVVINRAQQKCSICSFFRLIHLNFISLISGRIRPVKRNCSIGHSTVSLDRAELCKHVSPSNHLSIPYRMQCRQRLSNASSRLSLSIRTMNNVMSYACWLLSIQHMRSGVLT